MNQSEKLKKLLEDAQEAEKLGCKDSQRHDGYSPRPRCKHMLDVCRPEHMIIGLLVSVIPVFGSVGLIQYHNITTPEILHASDNKICGKCGWSANDYIFGFRFCFIVTAFFSGWILFIFIVKYLPHRRYRNACRDYEELKKMS